MFDIGSLMAALFAAMTEFFSTQLLDFLTGYFGGTGA